MLFGVRVNSGVARIASLGGREGYGKEGQTGCGQDEGNKQGYGAWRVAMELDRGRVL